MLGAGILGKGEVTLLGATGAAAGLLVTFGLAMFGGSFQAPVVAAAL